MNVLETARWGQQPTSQQAPTPPPPRHSVWRGSSRFWPVGSLAIAGAIPWVAYQAFLGHHPFSYDGFRVAVLLLALVLTCAHAYFLWTNNRALWWPVASIGIALSGLALNANFDWLDRLILWQSVLQVSAYLLGQAFIYEYVCGLPVSPHHKVTLRAVGKGRWRQGPTSSDWAFMSNLPGEAPYYRVRDASDYEVASESFGRRGDAVGVAPLNPLEVSPARRTSFISAALILAAVGFFFGVFTYDEEVTIAAQGYRSLMIAPVASAFWILAGGAMLVLASLLRDAGRASTCGDVAATSMSQPRP